MPAWRIHATNVQDDARRVSREHRDVVTSNHLVDRDMAKAIRPNKNLKPGATLCPDITTFIRVSGVLNSLPRNENLY